MKRLLLLWLLFGFSLPSWGVCGTDTIRIACDLYRQEMEQQSVTSPRSHIAQINLQKTLHEVNELKIHNERRKIIMLLIHIAAALLFLSSSIYSLVRLLQKNRHLRESEQELCDALRQAEHSIQRKNLFLSNMSHEIRTPLNALSGFSSILTESHLDKDTREQCTEIILQNSDLLIKLIDDVVDLSNLEKGHLRFTCQRTEVIALCKKVVDTVDRIKQTLAEVRFESPLPELYLVTDAARLQQMLINLLINATKFTSEGSITLSLELHDGMAHFAVTDTGCGIAPEKRSKVFNRFEKLHENVKGTGLGLSICQLIIHQLGGSIWIDPAYNEGARFCFSHPLPQESSIDQNEKSDKPSTEQQNKKSGETSPEQQSETGNEASTLQLCKEGNETSTEQQSEKSDKPSPTSQKLKGILLSIMVLGLSLPMNQKAIAHPQAAEPTHAIEQLRQEANALPQGKERMQAWKRVVRATQMDKDGIQDARKLLTEAQEQEDDSVIAYSVAFIINHLFAQGDRDIDSIRYWTSYALPIAEECKYWSMYFQMKYTLIQTYIYAHSYEYAKDEARKMVAEAQKAGDVSGELTAYNCWAIACQATQQWKEMEEALHKAHDLFKQNPPMARKIMVLKLILSYLDEMNRYKEMKSYLIELREELDKMVKQIPSMKKALNDYFMLLECYSISYHVHNNELDEADEHIEAFRTYQKKQNYQPYYIIYIRTLSDYYLARDKYKEALDLSDSALHRIQTFRLSTTDYIRCIEQRANIYYEAGEYPTAWSLYQEAKTKRDSLIQVINEMQVEEFRDMYKMDKLVIEHEQLGQKMLAFLFIALALIATVITFSVIYFFRMKRKLKSNREKSHEALKRAEKANDAKRHFLTTISHAIRVPLNSVVGFSQLITQEGEEMTEEEWEEYARIIRENTDKLLFQVNSVLDLSRLEAGMTKWQLTDCDLTEMLQQVVGKAIYLCPQQTIQQSLPTQPCMAHTDMQRLMAVMESLIIPLHASAPKEKEISFTGHIEGEKLHIMVKNSPLAQVEEMDQDRLMRNKINQLTIAYFGGLYEVDEEKRVVSISYPIG